LGRLLANFKQAREAEPYLARFEDDWATGQIVRQYINGKQKYENVKASGAMTVGMTRKGTIPTGPIMRPISDDNMRMSLEDRDGNGEEEEEEEEEEEWSGAYGFNNHDHEMDKEFEENGEEEGSTPDGVDNGNY